MAAVFIIGCASHSVESTDSSRSSLSYIGQPVAVTTAVEPSTIAGAQETSAVTYFATNPFGQIAPTFLVAYNTNDGLGWANSYDNGASWIQHSSTNAGAIAPIIPSVGSFGGYFSDPWVDQPSIPDSVFLSGIVRSQGSAASDAALALSSDGGNTFGTAIRITDPATGGGQPDVDAPVVAVSAQNHKAYVWWHQGAKSWLRPVSYTTSPPSMNALTPIDLSAKLKVAAPVHATLVAIPTGGVNADDTIYMVYSDLNLPQSFMCSVPSSRVTRTVTWWFSVSTNSGQSWTHRKITTDSKWPQCITDQDNGSNRTRAPIVYNPGTGRILLSISRSQTSADGQNVGLRSVLYQYPTAAGLIGFDSWIPVCNPEVCPPGLSTCMLSGTLPAGESFCNQYGQELAVTNATPVPVAAMAWHDTRDSVNPPTPSTKKTPQYLNLQVSIWGASVRPGTPYDAYPTTQSRITPVGPGTGVPWTQVATNGNTAWGDYEGMTAAPGGPFHAFWGDNSAGGVSQVFTAPFSP